MGRDRRQSDGKAKVAFVTSVSLFTGYAAAKYYMIRFASDDILSEALVYAGIVLIPNMAAIPTLVISIKRKARKIYLLIAIYCIVIVNTFAYVDTAFTGVYTPGDMAIEHIMNPLLTHGLAITFLPVAIGLTLSSPGVNREGVPDEPKV